ncbi:MAG: hypothetical protein J6U54_05405 [Clostridiales bacterium]|nr:hypothetical protein [Clostridiales bacterium]
MKTIKALEPITAYGPDKLALFVGETAEIEDSFADALISDGKAEEYSGGGGSSDNMLIIGYSDYIFEQGNWGATLDKTFSEIVRASASGKCIYFQPLVYIDEVENFSIVLNLTFASAEGPDPDTGCTISAFSIIDAESIEFFNFIAATEDDYPEYERDPS